MTKQQIIEKAITKAKDNGWKSFGFDKWSIKPNGVQVDFELSDEQKEGWLSGGYSPHYMVVIFDHDFAKALWPGERREGFNTIMTPNWIFHLKRMVISEDRLKYLGDHLDG